jgi:drug/metabolite transporter (DMT)-like permease
MIFSLPFYMAAAFIVSRKEGNVKLTLRQWLYILFLGIVGYYLSSLFDFIGLQYVSAGLERLILFLYPTFVVLINVILFKQKLSRPQVIAVILTYAGIGIAYIGELKFEFDKPGFLWGSFLIFLCAITFSIYTAGSGRVIPQIGAAKFTAYAMLTTTIGVFIHFIIAGNATALNEGSEMWWYGILLAIVATVVPSFLVSEGVKRIGSSNAAIISCIGPVSTILQAWLILGERIYIAQIIGTVFVIGGVLLIGKRSGTMS